RRIADTQRIQEQIREAIIGFALVNGRLPCPALPTTASAASGTKAYVPTSGSTTVPAGAELFEPYPPSGSARCMDLSGNAIAILTRNESTHGTSTLGYSLPAVIVSHGKNGYGGYKPDGLRNGVGISGDTNSDGVPDQNSDETANLAGTPSGAPASGVYNQYL